MEGLQAEARRREDQLINVQQLLQQVGWGLLFRLLHLQYCLSLQQQAELARSVPVEQHQQLEQSFSVLHVQRNELKQASQQQELMLLVSVNTSPCKLLLLSTLPVVVYARLLAGLPPISFIVPQPASGSQPSA